MPSPTTRGATVSEGDEVWFVDPQPGRRLVGVRWNAFLRSAEVVVGATRAVEVIPPGAVPAAMRAAWAAAGIQDAAPAPQVNRRPLAIRPLGPPPPEPPDGIDEAQARAALAGRGRRGGRSASPPDVPLEVVTITAAPTAGDGRRTREMGVRRADGSTFAWSVSGERWPTRGTTCWATRVSDGVPVRLVVPTPAGDVAVEPRDAARAAAPEATERPG